MHVFLMRELPRFALSLGFFLPDEGVPDEA
jgi:hypothetical protein